MFQCSVIDEENDLIGVARVSSRRSGGEASFDDSPAGQKFFRSVLTYSCAVKPELRTTRVGEEIVPDIARKNVINALNETPNHWSGMNDAHKYHILMEHAYKFCRAELNLLTSPTDDSESSSYNDIKMLLAMLATKGCHIGAALFLAESFSKGINGFANSADLAKQFARLAYIQHEWLVGEFRSHSNRLQAEDNSHENSVLSKLFDPLLPRLDIYREKIHRWFRESNIGPVGPGFFELKHDSMCRSSRHAVGYVQQQYQEILSNILRMDLTTNGFHPLPRAGEASPHKDLFFLRRYGANEDTALSSILSKPLQIRKPLPVSPAQDAEIHLKGSLFGRM